MARSGAGSSLRMASSKSRSATSASGFFPRGMDRASAPRMRTGVSPTVSPSMRARPYQAGDDLAEVADTKAAQVVAARDGVSVGLRSLIEGGLGE